MSPLRKAIGLRCRFRIPLLQKFVNAFLYPFCGDATERVFLMQKFFNTKKFFPRLSVRDLCILGLLMAITALLSIFCTFRIGTLVKIPTKFISVFVTAVIYGPVWGGICAASGDVLNALLAPVGPFVPQITGLEFVSGFLFGVFFLKDELSQRSHVIRSVFCSLAQLFLAAVINTLVYAYSLHWFPDFWAAFLLRIPACLVNFVLHLTVLVSIYSLLNRLKYLKSKGEISSR